ncbi:olfactory receptor 51I2-like [Dasypus novemcinctus]|uniref:olfactory receptor 51I2-like n=1 Tax=Dasypus novemcinctus TaxID=9361 RepID=UPI0003290D31|nr:olfactory receptor 51I2-like [Dasypus novemcinctus]
MSSSTILTVIRMEKSSHEPMYFFLSMLAVSGLSLCVTTLPTILKLFWFSAHDIDLDACLTQMYLILISLMESGILLSTAFDCYVAIFKPLKYNAILNNASTVKIFAAFFLWVIIVLIPGPVLIKRLNFCEANVLSHSYCLHPDIIKLSCPDHHINSVLGLAVTFGVDSVLILLSYVKILTTVLGIASLEKRVKALNTCVSHICAMLLVYIPCWACPSFTALESLPLLCFRSAWAKSTYWCLLCSTQLSTGIKTCVICTRILGIFKNMSNNRY